MKDKIIERLIDQGHIVIRCADRILNKREGYVQDIEDLHMDGNIDTNESIILLKDGGSSVVYNYSIEDQPNANSTWDLSLLKVNQNQ